MTWVYHDAKVCCWHFDKWLLKQTEEQTSSTDRKVIFTCQLFTFVKVLKNSLKFKISSQFVVSENYQWAVRDLFSLHLHPCTYQTWHSPSGPGCIGLCRHDSAHGWSLARGAARAGLFHNKDSPDGSETQSGHYPGDPHRSSIWRHFG